MEILELTSKEAAAPLMSVAASLWFWIFREKKSKFWNFLKIVENLWIFEKNWKKLKFWLKIQENFTNIKKLLKILKSVQEHPKSMWYLEIEASIGRSLKKAKGEKEKKKKNKYFLAFRRKAKIYLSK